MKIHLYRQPRKTIHKGTVNYYSLATCYREAGKNRRKILRRLGRLTDEQADYYRSFLRNFHEPDKLYGTLPDVEVSGQKNYLDVLLVNEIWMEIGLNTVFSSEKKWNEKLTTENIARILTINRVLSPSSKIRTIEWFKATMLDEIMGIDIEGYKKSKIFNELKNLHSYKNNIECQLWKYSKSLRDKNDSSDVEVFYFDGTTSWFEGSCCELAEYDLEKTRGFYEGVISLLMVTDASGYPIAWEATNGHTKDTTELKGFVARLKQDFNITKITYCFDRGVSSIANFDIIEDNDAKFISGIRDNQIHKIFDLERFRLIKSSLLNLKKQENNKPIRRKLIDGFSSFDDHFYFKDIGVIAGKRYIVSFNILFCEKERKAREKRIYNTLMSIAEMNTELAQALRDRDFNVTERDLLALINKHKVRDFFTYKLLPKVTINKAQSFQIEVSLNKKVIQRASDTDGLMVYITDHVETTLLKDFLVSARDIVGYYKGKYVIESLFREIKSAVELRPFFVWKDVHVKAHYDIAVMAAYINHYICTKLGDRTNANAISPTDFFIDLEKNSHVILLKNKFGNTIRRIKPLTDTFKQALSKLGLDRLIESSAHTSHGVCC